MAFAILCLIELPYRINAFILWDRVNSAEGTNPYLGHFCCCFKYQHCWCCIPYGVQTGDDMNQQLLAGDASSLKLTSSVTAQSSAASSPNQSMGCVQSCYANCLLGGPPVSAISSIPPHQLLSPEDIKSSLLVRYPWARIHWNKFGFITALKICQIFCQFLVEYYCLAYATVDTYKNRPATPFACSIAFAMSVGITLGIVEGYLSSTVPSVVSTTDSDTSVQSPDKPGPATGKSPKRSSFDTSTAGGEAV